MKKTVMVFTVLSFIVSLAVPLPERISARTETCYTCSLWPNPPYCVPNQQDEGYDDCEGQCDMRNGDPCDPQPSEVAALNVPVNADRLQLDSDFEVRGQQISDDAFAVRSCSGVQLGMVYSSTGLITRAAEARLIEFQPSNGAG